MKTVQPLQDKILVEPVKLEKRTAGGIYLPESVKHGTKLGKVVALGDDPELVKRIKIGDVVVMTSYAGNDIELDGKKYIIVQLSDVLGIVREYQSLKK